MPEPEAAADRKLLADLAQHGRHIVAVRAAGNGRAFAFSVGLLHTLGHPEVLIMGLKPETATHLINLMGAAIRAGQCFEAGQRAEEIAQGFPLAFVRMEQRYYREYLGYALWFYRSVEFPVLQCVWPDPAGVFPWEPGYDSRFFQAQRILGPRA